MRNIRSSILEFGWSKQFIVSEIYLKIGIIIKMVTILCDKLYFIILTQIFYSLQISFWHNSYLISFLQVNDCEQNNQNLLMIFDCHLHQVGDFLKYSI